MTRGSCKICGSADLSVFVHTARCGACGVLLYWPYPSDEEAREHDGLKTAEQSLAWYSASSFRNHANFTNMLRFAMDEGLLGRKLDILDYGGGGGQFAMVCRSHFPEATVYITDVNDGALLDQWRPMNIQISFADFSSDTRSFDVVFMNDVFEHVQDPLAVLKMLSRKLKPGGKIFVDTPKQFWVYPFLRTISKTLYEKVLRGTVSTAHLQIWSRPAFDLVVEKAGLTLARYEELSEYTMPPSFYLRNMAIKNTALTFAGKIFYRNARFLARNKIMAVLVAQRSAGFQ